MKKLGLMSLEMALPILICEHGEITPKALWEMVKHKVAREDFGAAIKHAEGWGTIQTTFKHDNDGNACRYWYVRGDIINLHKDYIANVIEALAEGTLKAPVNTIVVLTIKTKDIHIDRLKKAINSLRYAEVVEEDCIRLNI